MDISPKYRAILSGQARGPAAVAARAALWLASLAYGLAVRVRNFLYDTGLRPEHRVNKPVVCIGNLTAGGTGKTPAVEYVVKWFLARGAHPAILSRGYGARGGRNDEALLLAKHLPDVPHRQHADRFRAAVEAVKLDGADVLVLDDGFQHRRLARFANIVLIDATCPFGHGHLLPRGLLREPPRSLERADAVVLTRCDLVDEAALARTMEKIRRYAPDVPCALSRHAPAALSVYPDGVPESPAGLKGKRVALFSSIGNPEAFRRTVEGLGANVAWTAEFPDHHWYSAADVGRILRAGNQAVDAFVTTEKDTVKLEGLWPKEPRLMVLRIELEIVDGGDSLAALLDEALRAATHAKEE